MKTQKELKKDFEVVIKRLEGFKNRINIKNLEITQLLKNINLFLDFFKNREVLIEKLKQIEKTLKVVKEYGNLTNYPDELHEYQQDLKKFGAGSLLWTEMKYPHITKVEYLLGWKFTFLKIKNIEEIVKQIQIAGKS